MHFGKEPKTKFIQALIVRSKLNNIILIDLRKFGHALEKT